MHVSDYQTQQPNTGIYFVIRLALLQIYPAYTCFKAIKLNDHRQFLPLLIYWVSSTVFLVAEYFADLLVFWFPFYTEIKLLLVLWITLPQTKGAIVLYADFIEPFLTQHEKQIDKTMVEIQENTKRTLSVYGKEVVRVIGRWLSELIHKGRSLAEEETASTSTTTEQAPSSAASTWDAYARSMFSSIMNRGSQLATTLQASASSTRATEGQYTQAAQPQQSSSPPQPQQQQQGNNATTPSSEEEPKLERSDSYDSLSSFIVAKRNAASGNGGSAASSTKASPVQPKRGETWGSYLTGWAWSSSSTETAPSKDDGNKSTKTE
ncbi:hypothetical protein O0I10_005058 [Lichtheimia ornata]|uniref:Protein YOP1 n=1 Tax=Lichtheimia ornata TaxID=688661 RepID=A0AAD7V4R3_9FUNG|nr:uncharacterized protein O0I10_005058 [Lichtheimia ornata]KAJ8659343.1 hypothetical protein O0I10_005058 [Lichtheimia ornata]